MSGTASFLLLLTALFGFTSRSLISDDGGMITDDPLDVVDPTGEPAFPLLLLFMEGVLGGVTTWREEWAEEVETLRWWEEDPEGWRGWPACPLVPAVGGEG